VGAGVEVVHLSADVSEEEVISEIEKGNKDKITKGIIVQLPLPRKFEQRKNHQCNFALKDVDGLTATNLWNLMNDGSGIIPATALAVDTLLKEYDLECGWKACCDCWGFYFGREANGNSLFKQRCDCDNLS
jgi:methylenetetrahydrofolate dehydrogenase (NADP+)/methenyltetrahydrofolate cyclohydrolase